METELQKKLNKEFEKIITELFDISGDIFHIERNNSININHSVLSDFFIISSRPDFQLLDVWKVDNNASFFYLCNISYETILSIRGVHSSMVFADNHQYFYGFINTRDDFGSSYIKPESLADKFSEIFQKAEIDFKEHKNFSRRYYCLSKDPEKFKNSISYELMDYISLQNYIEIEFHQHKCLFRVKHSIANKNDALKFLFTGCELAKLLNPGVKDFR